MPCDTLNKRMHLFIEVIHNKFSIRKKNDAIKKADFSVKYLSVKMLNYRTGVCDASCFNQDPIELNGVCINVLVVADYLPIMRPKNIPKCATPNSHA